MKIILNHLISIIGPFMISGRVIYNLILNLVQHDHNTTTVIIRLTLRRPHQSLIPVSTVLNLGLFGNWPFKDFEIEMKLFYLLAFEGLNARRVAVNDKCDRDALPDLPHAEWKCYYNGVESTNQFPEEVNHFINWGQVSARFFFNFVKINISVRKQMCRRICPWLQRKAQCKVL